MEDITRYVGEVVKQLGDSWTRSNGVCLSSIQDLNIPRNGQDTCILPLDWTLRHHDSIQPVIGIASAQPIIPSMFHRILI